MRAAGRAFRRFLVAKEGSITMLTASLAVIVITCTAFAVDLGAAIYWQQKLQAATDAAALAGTFDLDRGQSIAAAALSDNGVPSATIEAADIGFYDDDPNLANADRFAAGGAANALHLSTQYQVPVYLLRALTGSAFFSVNAEALAYVLPGAGISVGTEVGQSQVDQFNTLMQDQLGMSFQLTEAERAALEATSISIFRFFDHLASALNLQSSPMTAVMASSADLATVANAAAEALSDAAPSPTPTQSTALAALTRIAQQAGNSPRVTISDFVAVGFHQKREASDMVSVANDSLGVPAMALLAGYTQMSKQNAIVNVNQTIPIPGLATIQVETVLSTAALGNGTRAISAVGPAGTAVNSAQGRVRLTITLAQPVQVNIGVLHLSLPVTIPVIADFGYGAASISDVSCSSDVPDTTDISVTAQSGGARLFLGSVTNNQLTNLLLPLVPSPAQIVSIPLVNVGAQGESDIAQSNVETLHFTWNDIQAGTVKTANGSPTVSAALQSLANNLVLTVNNAPLGSGAIISNLVRPQVSAVLNALSPELDSIVNAVGLRLGAMDVRATAVRCGVPALAG